MHVDGFDKDSRRAMVVFEGHDAYNLILALRGAFEQVGESDLFNIVGLGRDDVATFVKRLEDIQRAVDAARPEPS